MLSSILVGLDGSDYSHSAIEVGIYLARKTGALLVGLGVVDEPTIRDAEPRFITGGVPYAEPVLYRVRIADARREVELFLSQFSLRWRRRACRARFWRTWACPTSRLNCRHSGTI